MRQAKSNVQTQKIGTALAELGIPDIIPIPTAKVGEAFESLVTKLGKLLDVRKVREKEEGECRVLQNMKEGGTASSRASQAPNGEGAMSETPKPKSEVNDTPDVDAEGENDEDDNNPNYEEEDAQGEVDDDAEGEEDDGDAGLDDIDAEGEDESSVQQSRANSQGTGGQGHKRSASVFSQGSQQSSKRLRK